MMQKATQIQNAKASTTHGKETVVGMSAERRDDGLGFGVMITAHGSEDGTVMG
jgi:limonene-1,2-epoxide hydrolase